MRRRCDRAAPIRDLGGAVALLVVAVLVPAAGASASATVTLTAPEFVQLLRSGRALTGVSVEGDVRLGGATLRRRSTCRDCSFAGDVIAVHTTFEQPLDLDGSTFAGKVELTGARLKRGLSAHGAVFRGIVDLRHAQVTGSTDLSEATFHEPMLMGGGPEAPGPATGRCAAVDFCGDVGFFLARFVSLADFDGTVFRNLDFRLARFEGDAFFSAAEADAATFRRTTFERFSDFSTFTFHRKATFEGTEFDGPADFGLVTFTNAATFAHARFARGATFLAAVFPQREVIDSFYGVESDGDLNFASAIFSRKADFENVVVKGTLSFQDANLLGAEWLYFKNASVESFVMDVDSALVAVKHGNGTEDRPEVLSRIESSAKARGDLVRANAALYAEDVLKSSHYSPPHRVLDFVFYRTIAGYFVRPLHPLFSVLVLAALVTLARMARLRRRTARDTARRRRSVLHLSRAAARHALESLHRFGTAFLQTLLLIPPGGGRADERQSRQVEVWIYRILFACALIGFANSNPTLRQMLDAVR